MDALVTLAIYFVPFLIIAIAVKRWMARKGVTLSDVQEKGSARRGRARFFLGIWRREDDSE
jgi:hypothetical protein